MIEITLGVGLTVALMALAAEYVDSTLGMGYGTMLTPILLLMGFDALQVVPTVLLSELVTGLLAGATHHAFGNVDLKPRLAPLGFASGEGLLRQVRTSLPPHLKVAMLLATLSVVGSVAAVTLAVSLPKFYLNLYIGTLITGVGLFILATLRRQIAFSWLRIQALGLLASFNKGMSGGGYGPLVTGGQILSGVEGRSAVGITSVAEAVTCMAGLGAYALAHKSPDWSMAPYMVVGAVLSVPFSALSVRKIGTKHLRAIIGVATLALGGLTLLKLLR
jgi:uncharacterized membrane protein YfcA